MVTPLVLLGACSPKHVDRSVARSSASTTRPPTGSVSPSTSVGARRMPLVAVVHPTRGPIELRSRAFAELVAGEISNWSQLGATPRHLQVMRGPSVAAASAWFTSRGVSLPDVGARASDADVVASVE